MKGIRVEAGQMNVTLETADQIADALEVDLGALVRGRADSMGSIEIAFSELDFYLIVVS